MSESPKAAHFKIQVDYGNVDIVTQWKTRDVTLKVENSAPKQIDEENGKNECKGETAGQFIIGKAGRCGPET